MRRFIAPAALALMAAVPVAAQAQTTWTSPNLGVTGNRTNGCDLRVVEVTHSGSTLSSLRFVIANRATGAVRATAEVVMTGDNSRKSGNISGVIAGGQQATLTGFHPTGGSLVGTRVAIRFTSCTPA